jgi:dTDP-4-amino-4,6-dideoxygalactose transaminase
MHPQSKIPRIPLVDLKAQYLSLKSEIDSAIHTVIDQTEFILGSSVTELEKRFAEFCGASFSIGVSSATSGLHLALHALGTGPGDEVILPSHTFVATAEAVCHCGATPVFVDVSEETLTMDPAACEKALSHRTRVIIPVHLYGRCAEIGLLNKIAAHHGVAVLEDAAQAHGAFCNAGKAGNLGIAAVFSFYPGKNLGAFGDGGIVTTSDPELFNTMRMLVNHGRTEKYLHELIGFNYRLDTLQAAVVLVKLRYLEQWNRKRLYLARHYNERFKSLPCVIPPAPDGHVFHLYVLRVAERNILMESLKKNRIQSGVHYPVPCHRQPCFKSSQRLLLPVTERVAEQIISLPLYPELLPDQQERIISVVEEHCRRYPLINEPAGSRF